MSLASLTEAHHGCLATVPDPSRPGTGAVIDCEREANHLLGSAGWVDSGRGTEDAHVGPQADGQRLAWWDEAAGAVTHQAALLALLPTSPDGPPAPDVPDVPDVPAVFALERDVDVSGVSGTGRVAWGVRFPDGSVSVRWVSEHATTAVHRDMESVEAIHCHGGATRIVWQ